MKRNFIIRNVIIAIIVIAIVIGVAYYFITVNGRKYEIEKVENYNYFVLKQSDLTGVIDKEGNVVIDSKYEDIKIPNPEKGVFICYDSNNTKVLNENKEEILNNYKSIEPIRLQSIASDLMYEKSVLTYKENDKLGLIDFKGKKLTNAIYDEIQGLSYKEGELLVKQNDKYGVINIKGNKLINIEYDKIEVDGYYAGEDGYKFSGYIVSNKTGEGYRYGYIDTNGKQLLKIEYNQISRITEIDDKENIYLINAKNGQYGVIKNDKQIINNEYQSISYDEANNLLVIEKSKKYGVADLNGNIIVPTKFDQIDITGIYLYAKNSQGTVIYNNNGTEANIDTNISILNTSNEKYRIRINNENGTKYGVIGKDGKQIIEEKYNYIEYLYDNYFIVSNSKSKLGVIDDKDNIKIEIKNDSLQKVQNADIIQAVTSSDKTTRLYSKDMNLICEMKDAKVQTENDYIVISNETDKKFFNKDGQEVENKEVYKENTLFSKKENDKWGFVNKEGKTIVEPIYDKVTEFNKYGFAGVLKDNKWGVVNKEGKKVTDTIYKLNENQEPFFIGKYYQVKYGFGENYFTDKNE